MKNIEIEQKSLPLSWLKLSECCTLAKLPL